MRSRTRGTLAAVPVLVALLLTGCGAGGTDDKVASAEGDGKGKAAAAKESMSPEKRALKMAQCMREHGMDVADPEEGGGIQIQGRGKKMSKKKVDEAMAACRKYAPQGVDKGADPKAMDNMREYAKCMRENGVEEFPDPQGGGMRLDAKVAEDPDVPAADKKCKPKMGKGGGGLLGGGKR